MEYINDSNNIKGINYTVNDVMNFYLYYVFLSAFLFLKLKKISRWNFEKW